MPFLISRRLLCAPTAVRIYILTSRLWISGLLSSITGLLPPSSVSKIFSARYSNLDFNTVSSNRIAQESKRRRVEQWPKLEAALHK
ncbi:hypothetical protein K432DRAFT_315471 [Lepidopterella palustris CBS 459.81]|uniref:Uncharacterized protein n=1 Tax=Lepidopterella palustris CBS 459.81 TaxID=1314670 RepID=A0A8E2DWA3_9PEZI|nr:hypothetical protein K432DRAFT_315471 [Lepidopterella palustris CBS 459.81]